MSFEEKRLSSPQDMNRKAPPHYFLPQTLRNWPWQRTINPHYSSCKIECAAWFETFRPSHRVQSAMERGDFSLLTALAYPRGSHFNFRSCCDIMYTFFLLDDQTTNLPTDVVVERCEAARDGVLHVDKPRPKGEHIIGEMARQSWKRASRDLSPAVIERFEKWWSRYIDSVIVQAEQRSQQYLCTLDEYITARRNNIGTPPAFVLIEQILEIELPLEAVDHPYMQLLSDYASEMIFLDNDICSYKKELLADETDYNIITVAQKHLCRDLEGALQWVLDYYDQNIKNFLAVREKVLKHDGFPSFGPCVDNQVSDYVDGLAFWVRGNNEWHFASQRYFGNEGPEIRKHRKVVLT